MDKELSIAVLGPIILPFLYTPKLSVEKSQDFIQSIGCSNTQRIIIVMIRDPNPKLKSIGFGNTQRSLIVIVPDIYCVRICIENMHHAKGCFRSGQFWTPIVDINQPENQSTDIDHQGQDHAQTWDHSQRQEDALHIFREV
jgi:hypothetical protein